MIDQASLFIGGVIGILGVALGWWLAREPRRSSEGFTLEVSVDSKQAERKLVALEKRIAGLANGAKELSERLQAVGDVNDEQVDHALQEVGSKDADK